jgi:hypothetical protein
VGGQAGYRVVIVASFGLAAFCGLVLAVIVVLNLHIVAGLEEGYAASPGDVWQHSALLGLVDVALLAGGPLLGVVLLAWFHRSTGGADRRSPAR